MEDEGYEQTPTLADRYEQYVAFCGKGEYIKSFDEWLNS